MQFFNPHILFLPFDEIGPVFGGQMVNHLKTNSST